MNRLKYVLGIQVPRRLPSSASFPKSHCKGACRRYQAVVCTSKTSRLLTSRLKKANEFKGFHCAKQTRNGNESTEQQEFIQGHRNSTVLKRASIGRRYTARNGEKLINLARDSKSTSSHASNEGLIDREPRSYAQMIQFYSQAKSGGSSPSTMFGMQKSPFSTVSPVSQKWKNISKNSKHSNICTAGLNAFSQEANFSSGAASIGYRSKYYDKNLIASSEECSLGKQTSSYAKMIEKYSNSIIHNYDDCNRHVSVVPKRNVSTRLNKVHAALMGAKDVDARYLLSEVSNDSTNVSDNKTGNAEVRNEGAWVTDMDYIMNDLKQVAGHSEFMEKKVTEKPVNEPAQWLERVVNAHKKKITGKHTASKIGTVNVKSVENKRVEAPLSNVNLQNKAVEMAMDKDQRLATDIKQPPETAASNPANPIVEYIKRGPVKSTTTTQGSTHAPTAAATSSGRHPQIELRMTPSQNESVVSINMDELAAKSAGAAAKDQLSVVISSKRNRSATADASHASPNMDFGSMHVSISENTVPVKQIEFSINGKPVSELKSILARADKLDVVSSMDKVEIRIPTKTGSAAANVASAAQNATPVLNLQIAAKFNEPRFQHPRGPEVKEIPQVTPRQPPTPPLPRSPPAAPSVPPKPSKPQNVFNPNSPPTQVPPSANSEPAKSETTKVVKDVDISNVTNAKGSENVNRAEDVGSLPADEPQAPVRKDENTVHYVTRTSFSTLKPNEAVFQRSSTDVPPTGSPRQQSSLKNQNPKPKAATDNRVPSNIIPWWSSENSFNNIRKYDNTSIREITFDDFLRQKVEVQGKPGNEQKSNLAPKQKTVSVDIKGANTSGVVKKNETLKSGKISKSAVNIVRMKSPQRRWVPLKAKSGVRVLKYAKPSSAGANKFAKIIKQRAKSNASAGANSTKRDSDILTIPTAHAPKIVKYVSVTPQRANVDKKPNAKLSSFSMKQKPIDGSQNDGASKKGGTQTGTPSDAAQGGGSRTGKVNVPQPNTPAKDEKNAGKKSGGPADVPAKEEKNVEKKANAPADVSAKPATPKLGFGSKKEQARPETAGTEGKNLPGAPVKEDPRIKEIMKSMKPIEKKKDGTLIDYGVIVPSRKPAGQVRQIPRTQNKDNAAQQEKLTELKNVSARTKTAVQEKELAAKKAAEAASKTETNKPGQPAKSANEKTEQRVVITVNENNVEIRNVTDPTQKVPAQKRAVEQKTKTPLISVKMGDNVVIKRTAEPASRTLPVHSDPEKKLVNPVNKNESTNRPATAITGEAPLRGTVPSPHSKTTVDGVSAPSTKYSSFTVHNKEPREGSKKKGDPGPLSVQKPSTNAREGDSPARNNADTTGSAPLRGTINSPSDEKRPSAGNSVGVKENKISEPRDSPSNGTKMSANNDSQTGGPKTDSGSTILKMSDTRTPIASSKQRSDTSNENPEIRNDSKSTYKTEIESKTGFFASKSERPEKNLLYSSWLQRFKDRFDGNKLI